MGKFKIKETYLLLLIVLGLVSLGIYTTYAMFTSSVEIGDISLDTTLQYTFKINSNEQFTIGSDELNGFWMGKFELTGSSSKLTILPNKTSLRVNSISSFNTLIQNMQASSNIYGLNTSRVNTDSHMINNY